MSEQREDPRYIDVKAVLENKVGSISKGIAMDIIGCIWCPSKNAFTFDPKTLADQLAREVPARGYTEQIIRENAEDIKAFLTALPDGKWAPSPQYFQRIKWKP